MLYMYLQLNTPFARYNCFWIIILQLWSHFNIFFLENVPTFPLSPLEVLTNRSAHTRPSAQPLIDTSRNISAQMSGRGEVKQILKKIWWIFSPFQAVFVLSKKYFKMAPPGGRGGTPICVHPKSYFCLWLKTTCKFQIPRTPYGRKVSEAERKKERKKKEKKRR